MSAQPTHRSTQRPSGFVLVFVMMLYAGFAIPVSIIAMDNSFVIGVALAAFIAWQWGQLPGHLIRALTPSDPIEDVAPQMPDAAKSSGSSSGNASFDAYRTDLLNRLEREQTQFDSFLTRLRDARDQTEFDAFMDARAQSTRETS